MMTAIRSAIVACFTLIIAALVVSTGQAQDRLPPSSVFTPGTDSCGQVVEAMDAERKAKPRNPAPDAYYTGGYLAYRMYALGFFRALIGPPIG
jgi:hypothetical protein